MNRDTDRWVRSDEARAKLRDLLDEIAAAGSHVYVLRYDKPAAVLVPVDWYEARKKEPAPEGYYRDDDGTLKRQHDVHGGTRLRLAGGTCAACGNPIPGGGHRDECVGAGMVPGSEYEMGGEQQ